MNSQIKTIERICQHRQAKMMLRGMSEKKSCCVICRFLRGWIARQHNKSNVFFASSLLAGYEVELK